MKTRTLLIAAGVAAAIYLVWRITQGGKQANAATLTGGVKNNPTGIGNIKVIPIQDWNPPVPVGPANPPRLPPVVEVPVGIGPEHPPLVGPEYWSGIVEDSGTNVSRGVTPFQSKPLEWLAQA